MFYSIHCFTLWQIHIKCIGGSREGSPDNSISFSFFFFSKCLLVTPHPRVGTAYRYFYIKNFVNFSAKPEKIDRTRMQSSEMHTACLLIVSQHALGRGGCVSQHALWEVCLWSQGDLPMGSVSLWSGGCLPLGGVSPLWTDRHLWKHSLRKLRLWAVITGHSISVNQCNEVFPI